MKDIRRGDDSDIVGEADLEGVPKTNPANAPGNDDAAEAEEQRKLLRASFIAKSMTAFMTIALLILWPMPMYGTGYVFSEKFFTGWVVVGILWLFFSIFAVGLYPLFEGRHSLKHNIWAIAKDITGKEHPSKFHSPQGTYVEGEVVEGDSTPPVTVEKTVAEKTTTVEE
jgi:urea-proton symporter